MSGNQTEGALLWFSLTVSKLNYDDSIDESDLQVSVESELRAKFGRRKK